MLRCVSAVPVASEPITVAEVKDMLRIDGDEFDAQLPRLIAAAREVVERQTGWALVAASYEWTPTDDRRRDLPLMPATATSAEGVYPMLFTTAPSYAPAALTTAIVLLVGDAIRNPEASVGVNVTQNPAFERLVWPYRRMYA